MPPLPLAQFKFEPYGGHHMVSACLSAGTLHPSASQ